MPRAAKRKNETKPNPLFRAEHPVKGRPKFRKLRRLLSVPAKHLPRQQRQSGGPTAGRPGRDKGPSPPAASCKTGPAQSTAFHQSRVRRPQGAVTKYSSSLPPCQGSIADGLVGSLNSPLHRHTRNPRISVSTEAEWGARSSNPTWKSQSRGPHSALRVVSEKARRNRRFTNIQFQNIICRTSRFQQKITCSKKWEDLKLNDKRQ